MMVFFFYLWYWVSRRRYWLVPGGTGSTLQLININKQRNELLNVEQGIFGVLETDMSKRDIDISNISAVNLTLEPSGRPITVRYLHFSMPLLLHPKIFPT